jgi:internalin A
MSLLSSRFLPGILGMLCAGAVAVACGSDPQHKQARGEAGAGGQAGAGAPAAGGSQATPLGGNGGEPLVQGGNAGQGGEPVSMAGAGDNAGGAGGMPPSLPELPAVDCTTVTFKDANLDGAVRSALDIGSVDITAAVAASLTDLTAQDAGIVDLSGIECLTGLQTLDLSGGEAPNQIAELGPVRYLKNLKSLDLSGNPLTDLSPLIYLTQLQTLTLDGGNVPDLTPIAELPPLDLLSIQNATLTVPASLAALKNLRGLAAIGTIDDAALVSSLTQLGHLELGYLALSNADALQSLGNLSYLDVLDMGLTSAAPFATLTELSHLDLRENAIADVHPLQNLTGLSYLSLFATLVTDIKPLVDNQGLSNGDTVDLSNTPLACQTEKANVTSLSDRGVTVVGSPCP